MATTTASRILVLCFVSLTDIKDPMTRSGEQLKVAPTKLRVTTVVDTKDSYRINMFSTHIPVKICLRQSKDEASIVVNDGVRYFVIFQSVNHPENRKPETRTQPNILNRSISGQNLRQHARLQRAYSDHNLCYSANNVQASMNQPKLKNSCSMGVFNLKPSSSIVPKALKTDVGEIIVKEGKKRGNWIEMLMEIRSRWVQKQNNELDGDNEEEKGCDDGCEVDYNDDEDSVIVNLETFSGMLKHYLGPIRSFYHN
ncbi:hypothetical protein HanRHA438_Chr02g0095951 [Helianthus annuus]|nr:hypothetical protein HanRHA438_Chr02g0095951 [Helianthus annuus]